MFSLDWSQLQHALWFQLGVVTLFGFLTGLEIREYRRRFSEEEPQLYLGSTRTYTFIALTGWLLHLLNPVSFYGGLAALTLLYALLYWRQLAQGHTSLITFIIALLVYHYGVLAASYPLWLLVAVFVAIVFLLSMREQIRKVSSTLAPEEIFTLAKLLLLSAVILPLLPDQPVAEWLPVSPFKIWLAVVVVSAISYFGYVAQRYFFPNQGVLVTALFGGIYSSTATTVVLAKESRDAPRPYYRWSGGIVLATAMMYVRLWVIAAIFQWQIALLLAGPLAVLAVISAAVGGFFLWRERRMRKVGVAFDKDHYNPLDLKIAFTFAALFVLMMAITHFVSAHYGSTGLNTLALIVGFTDVDPFVLSLLTGEFKAPLHELAMAILIAAGSNDLLKAFYAAWFAEKHTAVHSAVALTLIGLTTLAVAWAVFG